MADRRACRFSGKKKCGALCSHRTTLDAIDRYLSSKHDVKEKIDVEVVHMM
jgi:hypothetical protein